MCRLVFLINANTCTSFMDEAMYNFASGSDEDESNDVFSELDDTEIVKSTLTGETPMMRMFE